MHSIRKALLALPSLTCLLLTPTLALGAEAATPTTATGYPVIDQIFAYVGIVAAGLSVLATLLPRQWKVTQLCARFSADLRGIMTPDTADDPKWAQKIQRDTSVLLILTTLLVGAGAGCAFFRSTVAPVAIACAPDRQYVIDNLSAILSGENFVQVLDRMKNEKGAELVICALRQFLQRVAASPETALERQRAQAYLDRQQ